MTRPRGKKFVIEKERSGTTGRTKRAKNCFDCRYSIFFESLVPRIGKERIKESKP